MYKDMGLAAVQTLEHVICALKREHLVIVRVVCL